MDNHSWCTLNSEGLALLEFRARVVYDPSGSLTKWNPNDCVPCNWSGIRCVDGEVHVVELNGYNLEGVLAPELENLSQLRVLELSKNHFSGTIPQQFGQLTTLEVLDLRDNNLSGTVPAELGGLYSMKRLLLCKNRFEGSIPSNPWFDENLTSTGVIAGFGCANRKCGHLYKFGCASLHDQAHESNCSLPSVVPNVENVVHDARHVLVEQSSNLLATLVNVGSLSNSVIAVPSSRSGSFPAVPNRKILNPPPSSPPQNNGSITSDSEETPSSVNQPTDKQPPAGGNSWYSWKIISGISSAVFLLIVAIAMLVICRSRAPRTMGPWKTGLSGSYRKHLLQVSQYCIVS